MKTIEDCVGYPYKYDTFQVVYISILTKYTLSLKEERNLKNITRYSQNIKFLKNKCCRFGFY